MTPYRDDSSQAEDESRTRHASRKLFKRRHAHKSSTSSVDMPEHLRHDNDAAEEEITAREGPAMYMDMNQSIFGFITAAGSRVDATDRFHPPLSEEEDEGEDSDDGAEDVARTTTLGHHGIGHAKESGRARHKHRHSLSGHSLLRSLPALPRLAKSKLRRDRSKLDRSKSPGRLAESSGESHSSNRRSPGPSGADKGPAPVMSRMLEARAEMAARPSFDLERLSDEGLQASEAEDDEVSPLARKLKEIFEFDEPEEVMEGMYILPPFSPLLSRLHALFS
jgi:sterol 3beta-glucosyltransferase